MKYLFFTMAICYGLTLWAFKMADRPGDDFGAGVLVWMLALVSVVLTIVYFGIALWTKSLW